jgi:hypothetical protein
MNLFSLAWAVYAEKEMSSCESMETGMRGKPGKDIAGSREKSSVVKKN